MAGRRSFAELRAKMSPEARVRANEKAQVLRHLIADGRASGDPIDGETVLKRLRRKYGSMTGAKTRQKPRKAE
jgi:hypothetical protein